MRVPQWYCLLSEAQRGLLLDKGIPYWEEIRKNILIKRKNMILNGTVKPKNTYVVWVCKIFTILDPNRQLEVLFVFQMSRYDKWAMNHHPAVNKTRFWSWGLAANMHRRNVGVCYKSKNLANHSPKYKKTVDSKLLSLYGLILCECLAVYVQVCRHIFVFYHFVFQFCTC